MLLRLESYPKCERSFTEFCISDKMISNKLLSKIKNVRTFDVTLRDGLQALSSLEQDKFTINIKKNMYNHLLNQYSPKNFEIGSSVNTKIFPIFKDTEELFLFCENINKYSNNLLNHYILVPNKEKLIDCLKFGARNFSFISSVSNSFQIKNTRMSLDENYINLDNMLVVLNNYIIANNLNKNFFNIKLYVSCIDECPIEGIIDTNNIIKHLVKLSNLKINNICLSDTCGTLSENKLSTILNELKNAGINPAKISLHLHVKQEREQEVEKIIHLALDNDILEFDVSELSTGGCSITMNKDMITPNLNYEQYYRFLTNYIIKNINYI